MFAAKITMAASTAPAIIARSTCSSSAEWVLVIEQYSGVYRRCWLPAVITNWRWRGLGILGIGGNYPVSEPAVPVPELALATYLGMLAASACAHVLQFST